MPIEATLLRDAPSPLPRCPECGAVPFVPFMRGQVQRAWHDAPLDAFLALCRKEQFAYCAVICSSCHEIVGHEAPAQP
jgi:hypothetical protein